jgi:hypothetical protein
MRVPRVIRAVVCTALVVVWLPSAVPVSAQQTVENPAAAPEISFTLSPRLFDAEPVPAQPVFSAPDVRKRRRPGALLPLYGSLIALQGLDIHSTRAALDSGKGREANPAMDGLVGSSAGFVAVKAGATLGVIWASEKMWKKNRKGTVIFAGLVNAVMAAVVAHNYRVSR